MIWFKRVIYFLLLLLILVAGTIGFVWWKHADDLKAYALEAVRGTITTKVSFNENVTLSLWKDFPLVAVEISELQIEDAFKTNTLIKVEKAYVQFNLIKILQNKFTIEGIRVEDGFLKLRRNEHDKWNFKVWKEGESSGNEKVDFSIEILTLQNIHLDYDDSMIDLNIQFLSEKSKLKGRFTDENTRLGLSLNGFMEKLSTKGIDRIVELPLSLAGVLNINTKDKIYTIETGNAVLDGNEMLLDAELASIENGANMELKIQADNMDPFALLPHIWPQIPDNIRKLELEGKADLVITLNGPFTKDLGPQLNASIKLWNGGLIFQKTDVSELTFEGKLFMNDIKQSKAMEITFNSFDLKTPEGKVSGNATLTNLNNPRLRLKTTGTSRLEEILLVAGLDSQIIGNGAIAWAIDFEGPLGKEFHTTLAELEQMQWSGRVQLSEVALQFSSNMPKIEDLNAKIELTPDKTSILECTAQIGHLRIDGEMEIAQFKEILIRPSAPINLAGTIHIEELDVQKLPTEWTFESKSSEVNATPRPVSARINTTIDHIVYNNFSASSVSGSIRMENERLEVTNLHFDALDGSMKSNLIYASTSTGSVLKLQSELRNIDISRTLSEWNDFGQKGITSKNLKGRASAKLDAEIHLNKDLEILMDKLRVESDLEISGGELIQFEPLLAMSKFISVDELNHVKFDTLRNQLSIHDNKLFIPRMSVSSSILNVQVFGEHSFNQELDYHVNLLLNDLLRRKAKKKETFDGHEIIDERGKTRLFLWVRGKPGDIKVGFDKKEVRQKLKADFKNEGQTIKQLFREEFKGGTERKDESESIQFKLEGEENSTAKDPKATNKTEKKKKKGFFSNEQEETETEGRFEIEFEP
ncbi:MAG: hypothetical protein KBF73_01015 [Flavobacteriales bacterium]|nr:hypothetical protein [Flavobacteriales bacterium]